MDSCRHLSRAISDNAATLDVHAIRKWCAGTASPHTVQSFEILHRIERRYRLPKDYFRGKLPHQSRATRGHILEDVSPTERRRLAWHLPDDFIYRSEAEQEKILTWVKKVIISGSTDYRRFQAAAMKQKYAMRFRSFQGGKSKPQAIIHNGNHPDIELSGGVMDAPEKLEDEMASLLRFKTSTLTALGLQRNGVWGEETAAQKVEHFGLMFGALVASPRSGIRGFGAKLESLTFAMLVFPAVWDWYLQWREQRRGFYTNWEVDMLSIVLSMVRQDTGWLRQFPEIKAHLIPIPGLISEEDIEAVTERPLVEFEYAFASLRMTELLSFTDVDAVTFATVQAVKFSDDEYLSCTRSILSALAIDVPP